MFPLLVDLTLFDVKLIEIYESLSNNLSISDNDTDTKICYIVMDTCHNLFYVHNWFP